MRRPRTAACAGALATTALLVAGCASPPPAPDWQVQARAALEGAVAAYLSGEERAQDFERGLAQVARTGRPDLLARAELMRCAARVASLEFVPCAGFEPLRADAAPPERAYADHLAARVLPPAAVGLLPPAQRAAAAALAGEGAPSAATLQAVDDPYARLIAIAVLFQAGRASPELIGLAADTASQWGWRRPLWAWLEVQARLAERAGAADEAARLRRRLEVLQRGP